MARSKFRHAASTRIGIHDQFTHPTTMASKSYFSRPSGRNESSILPLHNSCQHTHQANDYGLDELEPRPDDRLLSKQKYDQDSLTHPDFHPSSKPSSSNRKPSGARNRRPSNSSAGSASKSRYDNRDPPAFFHGIPPPIAVSKARYQDDDDFDTERYRNDDDEENHGIAASRLLGTARRALNSVLGDVRGSSPARQERGEKPVTYDRNSVWKSLARRHRATEADVQRFLEVLEDEAFKQTGGDAVSPSDGVVTPTGADTASVASSRYPGHSVSLLEPASRTGPGGETVPVRQPRKKKLGLNGARLGISRSLAEFLNIKAEEDATLAVALSNRKQALLTLRQLATRQQKIVAELEALEMDDEEPSKLELEDLENEHRGVCIEIQDLEKRLKALKTRRRYLEGRMDTVKNQREAGLSGYRNALKETETTVKAFLSRPPVKPLDVDALAEGHRDDIDHLTPPGGVEFMHLRPERRTLDMAREWWEAEVAILESRKCYVDEQRVAFEEGSQLWDEVFTMVHECENDLRKEMAESAIQSKGKGKYREVNHAEALLQQYTKITTVLTALEERMRIVEQKGWKLLIPAVAVEVWMFKQAAESSKDILQDMGVQVDEKLLSHPAMPREESTESRNSFHTVREGGSEFLDLPNNREDEVVDSDNEVPQDLLAGHEEEDSFYRRSHKDQPSRFDTTVNSFDGAHSADDNDVLPVFLPEVQHDGHSSDNEVPQDLLVEANDHRT